MTKTTPPLDDPGAVWREQAEGYRNENRELRAEVEALKKEGIAWATEHIVFGMQGRAERAEAALADLRAGHVWLHSGRCSCDSGGTYYASEEAFDAHEGTTP